MTHKAYPKATYQRSEVLRQAFRRIPCQHCGADDGTVCAAHSNWSDMGGKGMARKASDEYCAALCHRCHIIVLDQGKDLNGTQKRILWQDAHIRSVRLLVERKLWPKSVRIPNGVLVDKLSTGI